MENNWYYELELPESNFFDSGQLQAVLDLALGFGFKYIEPETNLISGVYDDELFESDDPGKVISLISQEGGLIQLWGDKAEISLNYEPEKNQFTPVILVVSPIQNNKSYISSGKLSVIINAGYFKDDIPERTETAQALKDLFKELCRLLRPVYAYCRDEILFSALAYEESTDATVIDLKPPVLYWFNYFSKDYLEKIGGEIIFTSFSCQITDIGYGVTVEFYEFPWQFQLDALQKINDKWDMLKMIYQGLAI